MIRFTFENRSDQRVIDSLRGKVTRLEAALIRKVDSLDARLQARIQGKLEGAVLKSHTHKLVNSVRLLRARKQGGQIAGYVQAGGGVAPYAIFQEKGAHIPEVSGKLMVFPGAERTALAEVLGKTMAKKVFGGEGMVFTMKHKAFDLPARPYMAPSLEEMKPDIIEEIRQVLNEELSK